MKRFLLIGIGLAFLGGSGVALAQMPPGGPGGDGPHGPMGEGEHGEMMEYMHHHHHGMPHGTAYHFKRGDAEVDIACSERESVQSCVSGATTLLDKLMGATAAKPPTQ